MHWFYLLQHWLAYETGSENTAGAPPNYNFWSGFGSDLGEATLIAAVLGTFKKHNCHTRWCWRIGHHAFKDPLTGVEYNLCRKHHPLHPGRRQITQNDIDEMGRMLNGEH